MNKEVIKAMKNRTTKREMIMKWWYKNGYKVMRVVLFPIWFAICIKERIGNHLNNKQKWNEEKADEILNYYVPRYARWNEEEKEFYFFDNGYGWYIGIAKRHLKRKDRRFWKVNNYRIRNYLIKNFELEGFTKEILLDSDGWTEISFKMK